MMQWIYEIDRIKSIDEAGGLMTEAILVGKPNGEIDIEHVYVDSALRGQGLAGETMEVLMDYLRENNKKVTASCSYANSWLHKNKEIYSDIISSDLNDFMACRIDGKH